ncbi:MAG: thioredoxin domain-containing protein [Verrucomicrobiota bacterium]
MKKLAALSIAFLTFGFSAYAGQEKECATTCSTVAKADCSEGSCDLAKADCAASAASEAKLVAMVFYSENCGSCKNLDPKVTAAVQSFGGKNVAFAKMDMACPIGHKSSADLAKKIGLEKVFAEHDGKYGFAILVDMETKHPIAKFTKSNSEQEIAAAIQKSLDKKA